MVRELESGVRLEQDESFVSREALAMYEISGQGQIHEKILRRYLRDKEMWDDIIASAAKAEQNNSKNKRMDDRVEVKIDITSDPEPFKAFKEAISGQDSATYNTAIQAIDLVPKEDRERFINAAFATDDEDIQRKAAWKIRSAPLDKRSNLIEKALSVNVASVQRVAAQMIADVPEKNREILIRSALTIDDSFVQNLAAHAIRDVPEKVQESLRQEVLKIVKSSINSMNPDQQIKSAKLIRKLEDRDRDEMEKRIAELSETYITSEDPERQRYGIEFLKYLPFAQKRQLYKMAKRHAPKILISSPLYDQAADTDRRFFRETFEKTGSDTTLLFGSLKDKAIIRHVPPTAFRAWQQLFEGYGVWRGHEFDYVPIEPIIAYRYDENDGEVDVFSGVLDLNLGQWIDRGGDFIQELRKERDRIMKVLHEEEIRHGHAHNANFALRFYRDQDGSIDFEKQPRIYLIDFDMASASGTEENTTARR